MENGAFLWDILGEELSILPDLKFHLTRNNITSSSSSHVAHYANSLVSRGHRAKYTFCPAPRNHENNNRGAPSSPLNARAQMGAGAACHEASHQLLPPHRRPYNDYFMCPIFSLLFTTPSSRESRFISRGC
jgi:hypothetical protein